MRIIVPKTFVTEETVGDDPFFFVAGPIRGGGNWQQLFCYILNQVVPNATIACPCRWNSLSPLSQYFLEGRNNVFERQLEWEQHYLRRAGLAHTHGLGKKGCVIFFLPLEDKNNPHPGPEPYAMDTRGELGEWRMRMKFEGAHVVVGGNPEFLGLSQIQRNFTEVLGYNFTIHEDMLSTARAAARAVGL